MPGLLVVSAGTAQALELELDVTDFSINERTISVTIQDDGSSNRFELEENLGLGPGSWAPAAGITLVPVGGGRYRFSIPRARSDRRFLRLMGRFLANTLDPDGDGLPSSLEQKLTADPGSPAFSDPSRFDTDGDGFSDGVEYAMGTEPNDAASVPRSPRWASRCAD